MAMGLAQTAEVTADGSCVVPDCAGAYCVWWQGPVRHLEGERVIRLIGFVGVGSAIGGIIRFLLSSAVQGRSGTVFPIGTLLINVSGSLLLGFLLRYALATPTIGSDVRIMLTTGILGGYTTFSTFSYETVVLIETGDYRRATFYVLASVLGALVGTYVGFAGARELIAWRQRL
jgi:CrcB protein